jgi:hypothetical protein
MDDDTKTKLFAYFHDFMIYKGLPTDYFENNKDLCLSLFFEEFTSNIDYSGVHLYRNWDGTEMMCKMIYKHSPVTNSIHEHVMSVNNITYKIYYKTLVFTDDSIIYWCDKKERISTFNIEKNIKLE